MRPPAAEAARSLVAQRYPDAVQAWLAGSVSRGEGTATSDLDITVLMTDVTVHRETLEYDGWPVELFVHTARSIDHYVAKDLDRRHPTMARLVATGIPLVEGDGGSEVRRRCAEALDRGPGPLPADDLLLMRYGLTDLLDDLVDAAPGPVATAVSIGVWRATIELILAAAATWTGTGKWLVRELQRLDAHDGTSVTDELELALRRSLEGDHVALVAVADAALARCGGRYRAGLHLAGEPG